MTHADLPPELEQMEGTLAGLPGPAPGAELRSRVMRTVRDELRLARYRRAGALAAAALAGVLLWGNLSLSLSQATVVTASAGNTAGAVEENARIIRELLPGVTRQEAARHAITLACGSRLAHCPHPIGRFDTNVVARYNESL